MVYVLPLLNGDNHGSYGVVCKMCIERFDHIPNTIELARKTTKMVDKWEMSKQHLVEVLACLCEHPCVIKFLAIHAKTMEAYTLWWNGGTSQEMLEYNMKYSPIMEPYSRRGVDMKRQT
jgi:predicted metal-binding protein